MKGSCHGLKELKKTTENLGQDRLFSGPDLKPVLSEYKVEVLIARP
jgi:hypothetical protein